MPSGCRRRCLLLARTPLQLHRWVVRARKTQAKRPENRLCRSRPPSQLRAPHPPSVDARCRLMPTNALALFTEPSGKMVEKELSGEIHRVYQELSVGACTPGKPAPPIKIEITGALKRRINKAHEWAAFNPASAAAVCRSCETHP